MSRIFTAALLSAGLAFAASPALAEEPQDEAEASATEMLGEFSKGFTAIMAAMMDVPVGPMAKAMADAMPEDSAPDIADIPADATLGDLARVDNPEFERQMETTAALMPELMASLANAMAKMLPQMRDAMERANPAAE